MKKKKLKKKLKKKIKHLEKMVETMDYRCDNYWAMVARETRETRDNTIKYGAKVNQLNADIANYGRIINEHASRLAANNFSIDDIYEKLNILKTRGENNAN